MDAGQEDRLETFAETRQFVNHPGYERDRERVLSALAAERIDAPIRDIVAGLSRIQACFTLQSCYGHFVCAGRPEEHNLERVPLVDPGPVRYRIAYVALCICTGAEGLRLRQRLAGICSVDTAYVQFGSPDWFWRQYPNSYALQVEPERFALRDEAMLEHAEALHVQSVRDEFFRRLRGLVAAQDTAE